MSSLTKGTILENAYEIIDEIGAGGGGIIYKARHLRLQTDVVVKKIKDEVRGKIRSRQEADILKKLKHPYLPRVYDFIETEDGVYTVMDFIHGENLDEAVKRHGKYSQKQVRKWAEQLGEALAYLHAQTPPIIHSDIKPANIMLTKEGNICLIDFNISLAMGGGMESAVGISAGFSPPEQYRDPALYAKVTHNYTMQRLAEDEKTELIRQTSGDDKTELLQQCSDDDKTELLQQQPDEEMEVRAVCDLPGYTKLFGKGIDARSDIYSLGVTLYFLLTGAEPPMDFEKRIMVHELNVPVSEGFALILEKMTDLLPDRRYQNGGECLKAIRNCHKLDHRYVAMRRKQLTIQGGALACLALGILIIFTGMYQVRREKSSAYYNLVHRAQEEMLDSDFEQAAELLEEAKEIFSMRIDAYEEEVYLLYLNEAYEECIDLGESYINTTPFLLETEADKELFGNIYFIVGNAYFETGDYPNAENLLRNAFTYNESNGLYFRDHAITLARLGQVDEAKEQLERGIRLGIAQDSIYMAQGEIAHVKGEYESAAEYFKQTIATTSDIQMKKRAILLCVDVYRTIGYDAVDEEIALLEQYRSQFEGNGALVMTQYLAEAYARKAQSDETTAQQYYEKSLALFQSIYDSGYVTFQIQQNMVILYENMKRFDEAETLLLQMTQDYPERYEVYKRLAYLEADRQQMKENKDRDYQKMRAYYEQAKEKYAGKEQDMEMDMLDNMMKELVDGGWF